MWTQSMINVDSLWEISYHTPPTPPTLPPQNDQFIDIFTGEVCHRTKFHPSAIQSESNQLFDLQEALREQGDK